MFQDDCEYGLEIKVVKDGFLLAKKNGSKMAAIKTFKMSEIQTQEMSKKIKAV